MKRMIIAGSPRPNGRSGHLAEMLFEANIDERPEDELYLVPVAEIELAPCIGCNGCKRKTEVTLKDDDGTEITVLKHRCVFDDDMQMVYDLLDEIDQLTVVAPVFFSGAPATLKALLDRLQPYYWANARAAEKRPAVLHVIGEGGDPHGYGALVSEVKSSLSCAGFRLERVFDWVGKIDESGQIQQEATETVLWPEGQGAPARTQAPSETPSRADGADSSAKPAQRPKLDLSASRKGASNAPRNQGNPARKKDSARKGGQSGNAGKGGGTGRNRGKGGRRA